MDAEQFLKDHQAEAFKKIGSWLGKDIKFNYANKPFYVEGIRRVYYNPLTNAEQWITCLFYYRARVQVCKGGEGLEKWAMIAATESREALLIAILEFIGSE